MELKPEALARHLAGPELKPIYLLAGDEHLLLIEAVDKVRARAKALGYGEREVLDEGFAWRDLAAVGASRSLFASRRVIEIRLPSGRPDKKGGGEGSAALADWARSPPPDTLLLISALSWSRSHVTAWVNEVTKAGVLCVFWPLKPDELPAWIGARATSRGITLKPDAVRLLAEQSEGNLLATAQEIDKLALAGESSAIDAAKLGALIADSARYDVFRLVDAALDGDATRALRVVRGLRGEGEEVAGLLPWVANQLGVVLGLAEAAARGQPLERAFQQFGVWQMKQTQMRRAVTRAPAAFWDARLADAAKVERIAKGRPPGDPWREFERLIVRIAEPRAARALAE